MFQCSSMTTLFLDSYIMMCVEMFAGDVIILSHIVLHRNGVTYLDSSVSLSYYCIRCVSSMQFGNLCIVRNGNFTWASFVQHSNNAHDVIIMT